MIFYMIQDNDFLIEHAQNRYIIWLLDILPVLSAKIGLPLRSVMGAWIVNYSLFFMACFFVLIRGLRSRIHAWLLLFLLIFTMHSCWFQIADEIWPSAALAIITYSYLANSQDKARSNLMKGLVTGLLFFIVFGHLMVSAGIILIMLYEFLQQPKKGWQKLVAHKSFVLTFLAFFVIRTIMGMNDNYEGSNMAAPIHGLNVLFMRHDESILLAFFSFVWQSFPVLTIIFLLFCLHCLFKKQYRKLSVLMVLMAGYILVWCATIVPHYPIPLKFGYLTSVPVRWFFPVNFLIVYAVCMHFRSLMRYYWIFLIAGLIAMTWQRIQISEAPVKTIAQFDRMFTVMEQQEGDKYILERDQLCWDLLYHHNAATNTLIYSSLDSDDRSLHGVIRWSETENIHTGMDSIYINKWVQLHVDELDPRYFHVSPGPYESISVDYSDCDL